MKEIARKIELPCHGIVVTLTGERDPERPEFPAPGGGSIKSGLHEPEDPKVEGGSEADTAHQRHEAMIDAIESLILAHARAGIDIASPPYVEGIETAVNACANNA